MRTTDEVTIYKELEKEVKKFKNSELSSGEKRAQLINNVQKICNESIDGSDISVIYERVCSNERIRRQRNLTIVIAIITSILIIISIIVSWLKR